jgi:hypothetical protein
MTIAFSTKSNRWTSRYSFEPTCYANVGQQFLSTTPTGDPEIIHRHDVSPVNNLFYGIGYKSSLSVASNEDPSATKAYEALSLESSEDAGWTASVRTIDQEGVVESFVERENDFYAEFPKNSIITQSNIFPVGTASRQEVIDSISSDSEEDPPTWTIDVEGFPDIIPGGILCYYDEDDEIIKKFPFIAVGTGYAQGFDSAAVSSQVNGGEFQVGGYDEQNSSLILTYHTVFSNPAPPFGGPTAALFNYLGTSLPETLTLYVASPSAGNNMKGDYAVIDVETSATPPDFELYAINVDQHKINLDHSLGQNN